MIGVQPGDRPGSERGTVLHPCTTPGGDAMKMKRWPFLTVAFTLVGLAHAGSPARASSHAEAPMIAEDPEADNTDLYAFRSPEDPTKVVVIANYIPLEEPGSGPNFKHFSD